MNHIHAKSRTGLVCLRPEPKQENGIPLLKKLVELSATLLDRYPGLHIHLLGSEELVSGFSEEVSEYFALRKDPEQEFRVWELYGMDLMSGDVSPASSLFIYIETTLVGVLDAVTLEERFYWGNDPQPIVEKVVWQ